MLEVLMALSALELLRRAGWSPDRRVPVDHLMSRLRDHGHDVVPPFRDLMAQFSGLVIRSEDGKRALEFDIDRALVLTDSDWCTQYSEEIDQTVTPVARQDPHLALLLDESGGFWGAYDDLYGYKGSDILQAIEWLLIDQPGSHKLDRSLPD
ncbi:hypothetical protein GC089_12600 [Cellulomonas sp. JZ18]|uniref:SUKH-3 domain-containing protein n=1 Tax=Cellulomonas sp. JZ18 TaxID=2654191 RepID=UPI0012D4889D|nr:SUKH-3 domain-containing protein [Cellulomonas sp. JZ18]QGQ19902.1 hypothetical protein GC089_12600 [Cellulomonas sp. JZ18]